MSDGLLEDCRSRFRLGQASRCHSLAVAARKNSVGAIAMPMPPYPVNCSCGAAAAFKIAARWSDGTTHELKTYYLACAACAPELLIVARAKRKACRLTVGETLDEPAVYELRIAIATRDRA